jgi:outer membrane protein
MGLLVAATIGAQLPRVVRAQAVDTPAPGLTLAETVTTTLESSPDIQLASYRTEASHGALVAAGAPFDLQPRSTGLASRLHVIDPRDGAPAVQDQLVYTVGGRRLFRNGMAVAPELSLTRTHLSTGPGLDGSTAQLGLTMTMPLLRDRGGAATAAVERAAVRDYESSRLGFQHTTAQRVLVVAVAYWDYLAAMRRVEVFRASEARAEQTVGQTRTLVAAEERTPVDLTQILGNLASRTVSRINADQALVEARQALGLAMGIASERIPLLPEPATDFPPPAPDIPRSDPEQLLAQAYVRRADLGAAEQDLLSTSTLLEASRNELKPRLDVILGTGYEARVPGLGFDDFFAPVYRHRPKLNASVQLSYQFPPASSQSLVRGRLMQVASAQEQQRILRDELRRQITAGVWVAGEALRRGEAAMRASEEAVRLTQSTVQAQLRKFELGVSTLFDVIQAEDGLTSALLSQIQSQRNYAVAVATLRFQGGVLVENRDGRPAVEVARLLTPP